MKNIEKAHEINRKIMRKFHAVCKKYGITYFYDSGSLIGAVRHQSFIPWDDDIDVAMKREDFWKLLQVPETEWGDSFRIVAPSEIAPGHFLDFTWRLMCMDETVPIKTYDGAVTPPEEFRDHIGLDILLLDNAHDSSFRHFFHRLHLYYVYGKILGHREWRRESYPFPANLAVKIFSAIGRKQPLPSLYEEYDRVSMNGPVNSKSYFYSNYPITLLHIVVPKEDFSETVPLRVDEDYFDGPVGYDRVLRLQYGDYMTLPPEEQRVCQHLMPDEKENENEGETEC